MTADNFCIVLTDGLVEPPLAAELLKQWPTYAPLLYDYLNQCRSEKTTLDLSQARCTALEYWQAQHNAALALLLANKPQHQQQLASLPAAEPFWLVELVHMAPSRDGAALIPAAQLQLNAEQNAALLSSAQALCEGTPFTLLPWDEHHWQLKHSGNTPLPTHFASSTLVARSSVNDWWEQDDASRDWRRFVNEIQMLYFDHPVNLQRQAQGLPPINSLWPVGGMAPKDWQPPHPPSLQLQVLDTLTEPYLRQDWGQWLINLQTIDKQIAPLLQLPQPPQILLTNTHQYLLAAPQTPSLWQRLSQRFSRPTPTWRTQWLAQS